MMRTRALRRVLPRVRIDGVDWPVLGAQVALVERERVLVQFRPWPPGWELPGGHCEAGEDPAVTAAREAEEETGYRIRIDGVVGVYTWAGLRTVGDVLYLASVAGGSPRRSLEAWASRFVTPETLPRTLFPWMRQRIIDALTVAAGDAPVHRIQPVTAYHVAAFSTAWLRAPLDRLQRHRS
jgi:8-oxo-dGTP pyrophosphatase MutT (NUDIX family)